VIKPGDAAGLNLLVQKVEECDATLSYLNYYSYLNNFDIIVQITQVNKISKHFSFFYGNSHFL